MIRRHGQEFKDKYCQEPNHHSPEKDMILKMLKKLDDARLARAKESAQKQEPIQKEDFYEGERELIKACRPAVVETTNSQRVQ